MTGRSLVSVGRRAVAVAVAITAVAVVASCSPRPPAEGRELALAGRALGTTWSVKLVVAPAAAPDPEDIERRVTAVLDRVDRGMSTWRSDAEIARYDARVDEEPYAFSAEVRRVVALALDLARETAGAFDPTVRPLVALWGFGAGAATEEPSASQLDEVRRRVGHGHLGWDADGRLVADVPGVTLDLSAIAKGYAVDALIAELARDRPRGLMVEVGGEVRVLGPRSDGGPWRHGVELPAPAPDAPRSELAAVIALTGGALATSGDYRQVTRAGGARRSHVIDPRTGRPAARDVASASVIAPTCAEADAVATALMVLGVEAGLAWVEARPWLEAGFIVRDGETLVGWRVSSGWEHHVVSGM